jgi:hypothetical protein
MNTEDNELQELLGKAQELIKSSDKTFAEIDDMRKCIDFALNEWKTNKRWFREEPGRVTTEDVIKMCIQYGWASKGNFEYMYNKKMNKNDESN